MLSVTVGVAVGPGGVTVGFLVGVFVGVLVGGFVGVIVGVFEGVLVGVLGADDAIIITKPCVVIRPLRSPYTSTYELSCLTEYPIFVSTINLAVYILLE